MHFWKPTLRTKNQVRPHANFHTIENHENLQSDCQLPSPPLSLLLLQAMPTKTNRINSPNCHHTLLLSIQTPDTITKNGELLAVSCIFVLILFDIDQWTAQTLQDPQSYTNCEYPLVYFPWHRPLLKYCTYTGCQENLKYISLFEQEIPDMYILPYTNLSPTDTT